MTAEVTEAQPANRMGREQLLPTDRDGATGFKQ
jgi:hypothetical protein